MNRIAYANIRRTFRANGFAYTLRLAREGRLVPHVFPSQAHEVEALNALAMTGDRLALRAKAAQPARGLTTREKIVLYTSDSVFDQSTIGCQR